MVGPNGLGRSATASPGGDDPEVHLVPLRRRHLRSVLRIEGQVYPKPWSFSLFMSELNLRSTRHYVAARVEVFWSATGV